MTLRALLTRAFLFSILVAALACDSGSPDEAGAGTVTARVSGTLTQSLSGEAMYQTATEDGVTATVVALTAEDDAEDDEDNALFLVLKGAPRTGTLTVASEDAGGLLVFSEGEEGSLYAATSGTVTRAAGGRLEGRFALDAVSALDDEDVVSADGTFSAVGGAVSEPLRGARKAAGAAASAAAHVDT